MKFGRVSIGATSFLLAAMLSGCLTNPAPFEGSAMPEYQVTQFMKVLTPTSAYSTPPKFLHGDAPVYPPRSGDNRVWGYAAIDFNIEPDGSTSDPRLFAAKGFDFAEEAAIAVHQWKFAPARKNGQPVRVRVRLPFTFRVD